MRLENKVAFITGSSSGIGEAIARRFAEEGATVIVTYNTKRKAAETNKPPVFLEVYINPLPLKKMKVY